MPRRSNGMFLALGFHETGTAGSRRHVAFLAGKELALEFDESWG